MRKYQQIDVYIYQCDNVSYFHGICKKSKAAQFCIVNLLSHRDAFWEHSGLVIKCLIDPRLTGWGFKPHRHHCVVSLSKTHLSLLRSTGLTRPDITEKLLTGT